MKLAIMQPYFFPYLGYFSLIKHTDKFILLDEVQFIRHGWIERNRVLKQNEGWLYISVPIKKDHRETLIRDILIDNSQNWKQKIISQLQPYKKIAPYYYRVQKLIAELFENEFLDITSLNEAALKIVCQYLEINRSIDIFSKMALQIERPDSADEWALNICKAYGGVEEYWNPSGGQSFFNKKKYEDVGIELKFQEIKIQLYDQKRIQFEPALSIIDVMMFNSVDEIHKMLDNYILL